MMEWKFKMGEYYNTYLAHYGVKGMKWGVRRYQNADGSLTDAGKERYYTDDDRVKLYNESKKGVKKDVVGRYTISNIDDITEAGKFLSKQNEVITKDFEDYCKSCDDDIKTMSKNKNFMSDVRKRLDEELGGPDQIDDEDLLDMVVYDVVIDNFDKYLSSKTKQAYDRFESGVDQYYKNVKSITDDIVGSFGNQPVHSVTNITNNGLFRKPTVTTTDIKYKDAVENSLHELARSSWVRYMNNHTEMAYIESDNFSQLQDDVRREYMKN